MTLYKKLNYSLLLLLCFCYHQVELSAQIMAYGTSQNVSGVATSLDNKSAPAIASNEENEWMTCWATGEGVYIATSSNRGANWSAAKQIFTTSELAAPSVSTDKNGVWMITWRDGMDIRVAQSSNLGATWSSPSLIGMSPNSILQNISDPVVATRGNGQWKIVWSEATTNNWSVYGATSSNNGNTWTTPVLIKTHDIPSGALTGINAIKLKADDSNNWVSVWTYHQRSFNVTNNTTSDLTTLWSASCDGNGWTTAEEITQNGSMNDPVLTNNDEGNWIVVWEEEAFDNNSVLQHKIYQSSSSDGGLNWSNKRFIVNGQTPYIAHFKGSEYALAFSAVEGRPNSGQDKDIVFLYSKNSGSTWETPQLGNTYGLADDGDWATGNWMTDSYPVMDKNDSGAWVLTWVRNYSNNNQVQSDIFTSIADSSPPDGTLTSDQGATTSMSTSLSFSHSAFVDTESGFSHFQWAFGSDTNPEAYKSFPTNPANQETIPTTITPADFADFAAQGFFSGGQYVFTIRAYNNTGTEAYNSAWIYKEVSVDVEVNIIKIGQDIPLPIIGNRTRAWSEINWNATNATPSTHTVLVQSAQRFIAADHGNLAINWVFTDGTQEMRNYIISPTSVKEPMILYHTYRDDTENQTLAPSVDISNVPEVIIHFNQTIPAQRTGSILKPFWINQTTNTLEARGTATREAPYIVLQYNEANGDLIDFEIVLLKDDTPDVPSGTIDIGSRLLPYDDEVSLSYCDACPSIADGLTEKLLYVHPVEFSPQYKHIWAIKKSTQVADIDIYWKRKGVLEVDWPFEYRQYEVPDWPKNNPDKYQLYVRGASADTLGQEVSIPQALNANLQDYQEPAGSAFLESGTRFYTGDGGTAESWSLLQYQTGPPNSPGLDWVGFEVVRSVPRTTVLPFSTIAVDVGAEITDDYHEGTGGAYVHEPQGDRYAVDINTKTGQVFGVNTGQLEVWWSNLSRTIDPEGTQYPSWPTAENLRIPWPSKIGQYDVQWGTDTDKIILARQNGSGAIPEDVYGTEWYLYFENNENKAGFNPNDEHALEIQIEGGKGIFPLRNDLGSATTSEPYVLMPYKVQPSNDKWKIRVFKVLQEEAPYFFRDWAGIDRPLDRYEGNAGLLIQAPFPLSTLQYAEENKAISGPFFEDKKDFHWAKAAGNDGGTAEIVMQYYYPIQDGFYLGTMANGVAIGTQVPWLPRQGTQTPVDISYTIHWPDEVPTMKIGQTIIDAQFGLPAIQGQCSVDVAYEQSDANSNRHSVLLIDPVQIREVSLAAIPDNVKAEGNNIENIFTDLSLVLRRRVFYDTNNQKLKFRGEEVSPVIGFDYALLNVMSSREKSELLALSPATAWTTAVNALYNLTKDPIIIEDSSTDPYDILALTSGLAEGVGYVTLVMQNADQCGDLPISLEIIRVVPELETNGLVAITPSCPFDETLTMRHKGDFGGNTDNVVFEWRYLPDEIGVAPTVPIENWLIYNPTPPNGTGALDITIAGPGLLTLSDNWIQCRYKTPSGPHSWSDTWSDWTEPQLAEGWIKRVVGDINAFTQRASGGGIEGAEGQFFDFGEKEVNTIVSMLRQSGSRWVGNIPLNCTNIDDFGLIEIYETVLGRGIDLSIGGLPPVDYPPANNALLLVASRIADMYTLMGNEAYADAADPTIAFSTEDGQYGAQAASIHSFQNQTATLLEEELGLLRGRDATNAPNVGLHPVYNKLYWNFTNGDGEVAYAANYAIQDQTGNTDGTIDEADAKLFYPQGHGDAWGHYLQATKTYYKLLSHPNYTWSPRAEGILLGGQPITVDYFDERKFAKAAAAKARTGAEIVDLTYRSAYVENPEGQWQGYKDSDEDRAWGFDEWADRTGQAAYFDWVVGNAIIPSVDETHTGVQKIDRTTVLELREVASRALEIQAQVDEANNGLNPLGLATNVVPFDVSPAQIDAGQTHFEQIYGRAVTAMNNAITVFNHANNSTQLLRRQSDSQVNFEQNVEEREVDFRNRLIEIFGYPYADDIGPGKTYPTGYNSYDKYHFNYVDASQLMLADLPTTIEVPTYFKDISIDANGALTETEQEITFHLSNSADQFGEIKPDAWTGQRRAPGEIQMARTELIQAKGRIDKALLEYDNFMASIEGQVALLNAQFQVNANEIKVLNLQLNQQEKLSELIARSRQRQLKFRTTGRMATLTANAIAEFYPTSVGLAADVTAPMRGAIKLVASLTNEVMSQAADRESLAELDHQQTMQLMSAQTNLTLTVQRQEQAVLQQINQLEQTIRQEASLRLELFSLQENIQQAIGRYNGVLARGQRLQEDLSRFRRQTAANVQSRRYKDMAFRIFRNDALQKYRAQYDLAARYVYLAAKAYDYETTLLSGTTSGQNFLTSIIKQRLIGTIEGGIPLTGEGLADPMRQMADNFAVFKGQLGFNNPQQETNRFSLRSELFRIGTGFADNEEWRNTLRKYVVENIYDVPEFRRYCNSFTSNPQTQEPAIVIPFSSTITFGLNFFGNELQGGDHAYSESNFTTKIRSVGAWFNNYNALSQSGLSATPRVYLIPVGTDIQRSPSNNNAGEIREFKILDQLVPAPFSNISGSNLADPDWIPIADNLGSTFGQTRQFSEFRAYHDSGSFNANEVKRDSRLIGRSVWNTRWLLIIPAGTLLFDREEGLNRFIDGQEVNGTRNGNGVSDIKIFFETYAFPGF